MTTVYLYTDVYRVYMLTFGSVSSIETTWLFSLNDGVAEILMTTIMASGGFSHVDRIKSIKGIPLLVCSEDLYLTIFLVIYWIIHWICTIYMDSYSGVYEQYLKGYTVPVSWKLHMERYFMVLPLKHCYFLVVSIYLKFQGCT